MYVAKAEVFNRYTLPSQYRTLVSEHTLLHDLLRGHILSNIVKLLDSNRTSIRVHMNKVKALRTREHVRFIAGPAFLTPHNENRALN